MSAEGEALHTLPTRVARFRICGPATSRAPCTTAEKRRCMTSDRITSESRTTAPMRTPSLVSSVALNSGIGVTSIKVTPASFPPGFWRSRSVPPARIRTRPSLADTSPNNSSRLWATDTDSITSASPLAPLAPSSRRLPPPQGRGERDPGGDSPRNGRHHAVVPSAAGMSGSGVTSRSSATDGASSASCDVEGKYR